MYNELKSYPGAKTYEDDQQALLEYLSSATDIEHRIRLLLDAENRMRRWLLAMGVDPELPTSDVLYGHYLMHWVGHERRLLHAPMVMWSGEYSLAG